MIQRSPLIIALALCLGLALGWLANGWRLGESLAELERDHASERSRAAAESLARLALANQRADQLTRRLAAAEIERGQLMQEKTDALRRLTTGRPCLDHRAVRLLNPAPSHPERLPEAASQPDRAAAGFATDHDVGTWIATAIRHYDTCRDRLAAVAEFYEHEGATE